MGGDDGTQFQCQTQSLGSSLLVEKVSAYGDLLISLTYSSDEM